MCFGILTCPNMMMGMVLVLATVCTFLASRGKRRKGDKAVVKGMVWIRMRSRAPFWPPPLRFLVKEEAGWASDKATEESLKVGHHNPM